MKKSRGKVSNKFPRESSSRVSYSRKWWLLWFEFLRKAQCICLADTSHWSRISHYVSNRESRMQCSWTVQHCLVPLLQITAEILLSLRKELH